MTKKNILLSLCLLLTLALATTTLSAAQRKPIMQVNPDEMTSEMQVSPAREDDNRMTLVWWMPYEYWQAILLQQQGQDKAHINTMLNALKGKSLVAIVQADISELGSFTFYPLEHVRKELRVTYTDAQGNAATIREINDIPGDLQILLSVFKPILSAAMGNMGQNFHFLVLDDTNDKGNRIADPFATGKLAFNLKYSDGKPLVCNIELPANALYIPRICPNGKPAHVSWKFCPWTGQKLPD